MRNFVYMIFAFVLIGITPVYASEQISIHVPAAEKVGEGRYRYLLWDLYDAELYAAQGRWSPETPFALRLKYLRNLSGKKIADKSAEEMRKQGFTDEVKLADWHAQMRRIFPDVQNGISLIGIYTENGETIFYRNSEEIGRIKDPEFGQTFFNIWLGINTSAPTLRSRLLGGT